MTDPYTDYFTGSPKRAAGRRGKPKLKGAAGKAAKPKKPKGPKGAKKPRKKSNAKRREL